MLQDLISCSSRTARRCCTTCHQHDQQAMLNITICQPVLRYNFHPTRKCSQSFLVKIRPRQCLSLECMTLAMEGVAIHQRSQKKVVVVKAMIHFLPRQYLLNSCNIIRIQAYLQRQTIHMTDRKQMQNMRTLWSLLVLDKFKYFRKKQAQLEFEAGCTE